MTAVTLRPASRKRRAPIDRFPSLPVPLSSVTGLPASNAKWACYTGRLHGTTILVEESEHVESLYYMGFFGRCTISKRNPEFISQPSMKFTQASEYLCPVLEHRRYDRRKRWRAMNEKSQEKHNDVKQEDVQEDTQDEDTEEEDTQDKDTQDENMQNEETQDIETQDIETPDEETRDTKIQKEETRDTETPNEETRETKIQNEETRDTETPNKETRDTKIQNEETRDTETPNKETRDTKIQNEETLGTERPNKETRDIEVQNKETKNEEIQTETLNEELRCEKTKHKVAKDEEIQNIATEDEEKRDENAQDNGKQDEDIVVIEAQDDDILDLEADDDDLLDLEEQDKVLIDLESQDETGESSEESDDQKAIRIDDTSSEDGDKDRTFAERRNPSLQDDPYPINEFIHLSLVEGLFLSYALGCLVIEDITKKKLDILTYWEYCCKMEPSFIPSYVCYHYFRSKGWIVRPGLKLGTDFCLYKDGPPYYHSSYSVVVLPVTESMTPDPLFPSQKLTWAATIGLNRIVEHTVKETLLCYAVRPEEVGVEELKRPSCVSKFQVQMLMSHVGES